MKKPIAAILAYLCLAAATSWSQDAMEFYNLGLKSSLTYKKIEYFSKALRLNPNLVEAYEKRALHYFYQRRLDDAIRDYTRVIRLRPRRTNAYLMLGLAYLEKKRGEGIKAEIHNLVYNLSKHSEPMVNPLLESAIENLSRAIKLDPHLASAYSYRAEAYRIKRMPEEAIRDAHTTIQLRGEWQSTARAYATLAKVFRKLGRNDLSETYFRKSVALDPFSPDYPPLHVPLIFHDYAQTPNPESIGWLGTLAIIVIALVVVFKLTLPAPQKKQPINGSCICKKKP